MKCKHKKIVLIGGGHPDYHTDSKLKRIVCGECGCNMTRKIDPEHPTEYIYLESNSY
jgi:hypothetical protein